jgi:nicotinate phosphoribosyltransferase
MINSILDNDLYKFTMQWAVHRSYPGVKVKYVFTNRSKEMVYNLKAFEALKNDIDRLKDLKLTKEEENFLREKCPFLPEVYIGYLKQFRYHPEMVSLDLDDYGGLHLEIDGDWEHGILFEVPLMALISENYFKYVDTNWVSTNFTDRTSKKAIYLNSFCKWADFGTRRRRNYQSQSDVVSIMSSYENFVGTSNVHMAMKYGVKPIGTAAHEWTMGTSVMCSLRHANRYAMENWAKVYDADLGIALTDTYGTDAFLKDFNMKLAKMYDGVRHDSGCPFAFVDKMVSHYRKLRIDPLTKTIVFSDGLDPSKAFCIAAYCKDKIKCSFGIGTTLTNDFRTPTGHISKPMNIVIKLRECDNVQVVKLSDNHKKATGDIDAIRVAKYVFNDQPLDGI